MKNKGYGVMIGLILFSLLVTGIAIVLMPDQVPMHYNAVGEIDRIGSKYENLLFPAVILLMGLFFILMARALKKKKEYGSEKVLIISGAVTLFFLNLTFGSSLYHALTYASGSLNRLEGGTLFKLNGLFLGVLFCALGNYLPKVRRNALLGLRMSWSMKNDRVWQKSQRAGGISLVMCGVAVVLFSLFLDGTACLVVMPAVLSAEALFAVLFSFFLYQKDRRLHPDDYS